MKKIIKISLATAVLMSMGTVSAQEKGIKVINDVYIKGESRVRYEGVMTKDNKGDANALTNRLALGIGIDKLFDNELFGTYIEMTDVGAIKAKYNSTSNDRTELSTIADPEQARLTQAYLDIKPAKGLLLRAGRQIVNLDNQRFIGAVGWRQMPQTFDAYLLSYTGLPTISLAGAYVTGVNTIFADKKGDTHGNNRINTRSAILHGAYKASNEMTLIVYGYMVGSAHDTYGLAFVGKPKVSDNFTINYRVEHAFQVDATMKNKGNANNALADADYYNFELGINLFGFLANANYEVLSGKKGKYNAFDAPLGTKHKFNGWADKFLTTPDRGLMDTNFMLGYKSKNAGTMKVIYHKYQNQTGNLVNYGTEVNALYKRRIPGANGLVGMLKYADYKADTYLSDDRKFWAMLDYNFSLK